MQPYQETFQSKGQAFTIRTPRVEDAAITAETVPGRYDAQSGRYDFAQDSIAFATRLFPAAEGSAATPAPSPSPAPSDPLEPEATVSPTRQP